MAILLPVDAVASQKSPTGSYLSEGNSMVRSPLKSQECARRNSGNGDRCQVVVHDPHWHEFAHMLQSGFAILTITSQHQQPQQQQHQRLKQFRTLQNLPLQMCLGHVVALTNKKRMPAMLRLCKPGGKINSGHEDHDARRIGHIWIMGVVEMRNVFAQVQQ